MKGIFTLKKKKYFIIIQYKDIKMEKEEKEMR